MKYLDTLPPPNGLRDYHHVAALKKSKQKRQRISALILLLISGLVIFRAGFSNFSHSYRSVCAYIPFQRHQQDLLNHQLHTDRTHLFLDKLDFDTDDTNPTRDHLTIANRAAVACDVPYCSTLATEILKRGGSAVDAAVTTALCIGSINSFSSGIGGGGFMVVRHPNGTSKAFNFREVAPALADKHMYDNMPLLSKLGGLAVGVPGELAGLDAAFQMYSSGKLAWRDLIDPVIKLNRGGFSVEEPLERAAGIAVEILRAQRSEQLFDWLFTKADDGSLRPVQRGDKTFRPNFANTLELIANNGSSAVFYDPEGPIAPHLVNMIKTTGGILSLKDFASYKVKITDTLKTEFMGREVITAPNPASGPVLILGLNLMSEFKDEIKQKDFSPIATQRMIEAMKWMGAGRSELGDVVDQDNTERIEELMTKEWARKIRKNVSDHHTHPWQDYDPAYETNEPHGTAHFSIIDQDGMAVSMTTTVNLLFGALIADPKTGIVLNNEMDDFSIPATKNAFELQPSIYNYVAPFKRPLSSCVPTIISGLHGGRPEFVIGAAGGSRISTAVFQAILRKLKYGNSLLDVIAQPRLHHQLLPDVAYIEEDGPEQVLEDLKARGHSVARSRPMTAMNGIYIDPKTRLIHAVSDFWRKRGAADGY